MAAGRTDGRRGCDGIAPYGTGEAWQGGLMGGEGAMASDHTEQGTSLRKRGSFTQHAASGYTARGIGLHSTRRQTASYGEDSLMSFSEDLEL